MEEGVLEKTEEVVKHPVEIQETVELQARALAELLDTHQNDPGYVECLKDTFSLAILTKRGESKADKGGEHFELSNDGAAIQKALVDFRAGMYIKMAGNASYRDAFDELDESMAQVFVKHPPEELRSQTMELLRVKLMQENGLQQERIGLKPLFQSHVKFMIDLDKRRKIGNLTR